MCKLSGIILRYTHTLQGEISYADVLGFCQLQDKTLLYYIHELQSQIPFTHVLGLCKLQYKIVLCFTCYA